MAGLPVFQRHQPPRAELPGEIKTLGRLLASSHDATRACPSQTPPLPAPVPSGPGAFLTLARSVADLPAGSHWLNR